MLELDGNYGAQQLQARLIAAQQPMQRVACTWPTVNDGTAFTDHITERRGTGQTLLDFYASKHSGTTADRFIACHAALRCTCVDIMCQSRQNILACRWRERILSGQCSVNGEVVLDPDHRLTSRATLQYTRPPWAEPPAPAHLDVLYADAHGVVAVAKPSGLQVLASLTFVFCHQRCRYGSLCSLQTYRRSPL